MNAGFGYSACRSRGGSAPTQARRYGNPDAYA